MPNFVPVVYSGGGPVLASSGAQRVAVPPLAEWLFWYDALRVARGRGHVTYYQTMGGADASAGTHLCGSAWDEKYTSDAAIMDAREMGADLQHRVPGRDGWPTSGADHNHGVLPCGYNNCNQYQFDAYLAGFNGLGAGGRAARDRLPRPSVIRTWQQGIAWAKAEIARLNGTAPEPAPQEDTMDVYAFTTPTGTGYRLRTELGETDLGSMGEVDAVLSALNSKVTRVWDGVKWVIHTEHPCLASEAQVLATRVAAIRAQSTAAPATVTTTATVDVAAIAAAVRAAIIREA